MGQLGYDVVNELTKRGIEAVGVDIQDMDITDAASVEKVIGKAAPDAVIHCAESEESGICCKFYRCSEGDGGRIYFLLRSG